MAILLRHEDIIELLTTDEVIQAIRSALLEQGEGLVQVPPRTTIDATSGHGWLRIMPAILNGSNIMGYKAMNSTPRVGVRYMVVLYDLSTGTLIAQMDADWITASRTAAMAAIATDELSQKDIDAVGLIGSSEQARFLLTAVSRVRKISCVKIFSPNSEHRRTFAENMGRLLGFKIIPVESAEQAVTESALVLSAYRAGTIPVLKGEWLHPGAHVNAISAVRPEARELHTEVWGRSVVVAVDDREHVLTCGDGRSAVASGDTDSSNWTELWEIVCGNHPGRTSENDITLFKSVGNALQDLALAAAIYRKAKESRIGKEIGEFPHVRV